MIGLLGIGAAVAVVIVVVWRLLVDVARTIGADLAESQHEEPDW